ncbi:TPA: hypothetical protein I8Y25_002373 [Raoultella ornithinolytica]|nr:hypothetical protein [Raoultella ornithinolytica]HAT1616452.1 hypothetical protein [Raoultella ornithinolytica]
MAGLHGAVVLRQSTRQVPARRDRDSIAKHKTQTAIKDRTIILLLRIRVFSPLRNEYLSLDLDDFHPAVHSLFLLLRKPEKDKK